MSIIVLEVVLCILSLYCAVVVYGMSLPPIDRNYYLEKGIILKTGLFIVTTVYPV